jgi:hypothetical protein
VKTLLITLIAGSVVSCATPKATVIAEAPKPAPAKKDQQSAPLEASNTAPDDGLRIGDDILALPSDEQLRSSPTPTGDGDATVITRPPAE